MYLFIHFLPQYQCSFSSQSPLRSVSQSSSCFPLRRRSHTFRVSSPPPPHTHTHTHTSSHCRTRCILFHCQAILYNSSRNIVRFSRHSLSLSFSIVFGEIWSRQRSTHKKPISGVPLQFLSSTHTSPVGCSFSKHSVASISDMSPWWSW